MKKLFEPVQWLKERSPAKLDSLFREADRVRKLRCGNAVHLRGIVEFSNHCRRDCLYCGLRRSNRSLRRYRLTPAEILESAQIARDTGIPSVVLQSGEDPGFGPREAARVVSRIKRMGLAVTLSMGELPADGYRRLRDAGADRYLLKFETSDEGLYARLRPGCALRDRLACLETLRKFGYQVGSGTMIGLPGQSIASIAADISLFRELELDMIGIGPFIPHPATPLAAAGVCCLEMVLKAVALTRLAVPAAHIPATTAAGTIDTFGREKALRCGGNVVMPNITPSRYRRLYQIYPGKVCVDENARDCVPCLRKRIRSLGRTIARGRGDALKR